MNIKDLMNKIDGKFLTQGSEDIQIDNVYICDLLSWVMSHAKKGDAWITVLTNVNVPAVAMMTEVGCVIIAEGIDVEELTLKKARENGIVMIGTEYSAFEVCKRILGGTL
jgi:hypothetical protein